MTKQLNAEVLEDGKTRCPICKTNTKDFFQTCPCGGYWNTSKLSEINPVTGKRIPYCYVN